ncbi:hypothetical protein RRG08_046436 [Elysia crispata]|uniref:Uncharacterized protein n=1 Tax=Elysia crispata TaxID=231223 RepID=A0AAE1CZF1_9GAST|nr:hypothetical protein RRG08_046436 [Elysia crispata]
MSVFNLLQSSAPLACFTRDELTLTPVFKVLRHWLASPVTDTHSSLQSSAPLAYFTRDELTLTPVFKVLRHWLASPVMN